MIAQPFRHVMCALVCDVCDGKSACDELHIYKDPFKSLTELWACSSCVESLGEDAFAEHVRNTTPNKIDSKVLGLDLTLPVTVKRSSGAVESDWMICGDAPVVLFPEQRQISIKLVDKTFKLQRWTSVRNLVVFNPRFELLELNFITDSALRLENQLAWRTQLVDSKFFTRKLMLLLLKLPMELVREMLAFFILKY